jgi:hypothetical protein
LDYRCSFVIQRLDPDQRRSVARALSLPSGQPVPCGCLATVNRHYATIEVLRSDNLSASMHDLRCSHGRVLNRRNRDLLDHYGLRASLIQFPA